MNINDILTLTQAGWSKDEIIALSSAENPAPAAPIAVPAAEPVPAPAPAPVKVEPVANPTPAPAQPSPVLTQEQFTQLLQAVKLNNATVDLPPKFNLDEQLASHFTAIMGGKSE